MFCFMPPNRKVTGSYIMDSNVINVSFITTYLCNGLGLQVSPDAELISQPK